MKKILKRSLAIIAALMLMLSFAGCGAEEGIDPNNYVTAEKYAELTAADWGSMSYEEMQEFLDVQGVVDEEGSESWGEGYIVADFPGPDEDSRLHVLFSPNEDGTESASSISPTGVLAE